MNIGQAAKASGIPAKMIRYYEAIGLIPRASRLENRYRSYGSADVHRLRFVRCARNVGLSLDEVSELLRLWSYGKRRGSDVKAMALAHLADLEARGREIADLLKTLRRLTRRADADRPQRAANPARSKRPAKR